MIGRLFESLQELTPLDIAYLRQLSCCIDISGLTHYKSFEEILFGEYEYFFRDYGTQDTLQELISQNPVVNIRLDNRSPFILDGISNRVIFMCQNEKILVDILQRNGHAARLQDIKTFLLSRTPLTNEEIRRVMVSYNANWQYTFDILNRENVMKLELTPLGMYIAKKTIKKNVGLNTPELKISFNA